MSRLEKYPKYKDSGVEWLGEIPSEWELTRLGTRFIERKEKVSDKDYEPLSVTKNGIVPQLDSAAKSNDGDNRKLVKKGDFVINSRSDRKGSSGVSPLDGSVSLINIALKPLNINPDFCNYLLKSNGFVEEYYRNGHGIVADLWTTRFWDMKSIMLGIPPLQEQQKIASFLDTKTQQLDKAIKQKEQLIKLLKERKQIVINEAVTKGIDKTVTMKDSGVEWLGEIPKHWEVKKLKFIVSKVGSGVTPSGGALGYLSKGIALLRSQNILFEKIDYDNAVFISKKTHKKMKNSQVQYGDILLNITGGSIGRCNFVNVHKELNVNQHVCIIRPKNNIETVLLNSILKSEVGQSQIWSFQQGGGREGLNFEAINNFDIPLPPPQEQKQIVEYIENQTSKIDNAINLQQKQIEKLKEYKTSLIDSIVTGKVRVCDE